MEKKFTQRSRYKCEIFQYDLYPEDDKGGDKSRIKLQSRKCVHYGGKLKGGKIAAGYTISKSLRD